MIAFPIRRPITDLPVHVTYRLYGSIPHPTMQALKDKQAARKALVDPRSAGAEAARRRIQIQYELEVDAKLHDLRGGPMHLANQRMATEVLNSWQYLDHSGAVRVLAVCVMSNHVHTILACPEGVQEVLLGNLFSRHKRHTARQCNRLLGRTGQPFWEPEYFVRHIRHHKFMKAMWYVLDNPVKAKLVDEWTQWPGTFVHPEYASAFQEQVA